MYVACVWYRPGIRDTTASLNCTALVCIFAHEFVEMCVHVAAIVFRVVVRSLPRCLAWLTELAVFWHDLVWLAGLVV